MSGGGNNSWEQFMRNIPDYPTPGSVSSGTNHQNPYVYVPDMSHIPNHPTQSLSKILTSDEQTPMTHRAPNSNTRIGYSPSETEKLFEVWVATSNDPVAGNQQKDKVFWEKVTDTYNAKKPSYAPFHTHRMLRAHFARVSLEIHKFCAIFNNEKRRYESGMSEADVLKAAIGIYQVDNKKPFKYFTTWEKVSHIDKWAGGIESNSDSSSKRMKHNMAGLYSTSDDGQSTPVSEGVMQPRQRLIGTKVAKAKGKGRARPSQWSLQAPPVNKSVI